MEIVIDKNAGCCFGVVRTIQKVENALTQHPDKDVSVLGEIIHNPHEIKRLEKIGLRTIEHSEIPNLARENNVVVIRAHGEPPQTYEALNGYDINYIDATCPLVKRLQETLVKYYNEGWQIIIFGKYEHAEVIGLRGVVNDDCIVTLDADTAKSKINFERNTILFSQTTMDVNILFALYEELKKSFSPDVQFLLHNSVCKFMVARETHLKEFASECDIVLFVAGSHSSNGQVLYNVCKKVNPNTFMVESIEEINIENIRCNKLGITGATSTPKWYLNTISQIIETKLGL